eukprot:5125962-Alexandrium_andersonii.AAC.1
MSPSPGTKRARRAAARLPPALHAAPPTRGCDAQPASAPAVLACWGGPAQLTRQASTRQPSTPAWMLPKLSLIHI